MAITALKILAPRESQVAVVGTTPDSLRAELGCKRVEILPLGAGLSLVVDLFGKHTGRAQWLYLEGGLSATTALRAPLLLVAHDESGALLSLLPRESTHRCEGSGCARFAHPHVRTCDLWHEEIPFCDVRWCGAPRRPGAGAVFCKVHWRSLLSYREGTGGDDWLFSLTPPPTQAEALAQFAAYTREVP